MNEDLELLYLEGPVGKGQHNGPDDVEAFDNALRKIGAYTPPPEYADNSQRYTTEPMIGALERFQEQNGLKVDGVANPGGPTERAINNRLLNKPRGAGLLYDPPAPPAGTVGNGFENRRDDVASVQRKLGALTYLPEDPFDKPHGFIDEATTNGIKAFQRAKGLIEDGWLAPLGETERALDNAIADLARAKGSEWLAFADRAGRAQQAHPTALDYRGDETTSSSDDAGDIVPVKGPPVATGPAPSLPGAAPRARRGLEPRGLLEVDPRFLPPSRPALRWSEPLPRDAEWTNPGPRPQQPIRPQVPLGPPTDESGPVSVDDLDRALRREPKPDPKTLVTHVPEPGSVLGIPILDINPFGRPGDPRTVDANRTLARAIEEGCKQALKDDATVTHFAGPGSTNEKERAVKGGAGRSFPDTETQIAYKGMTIRIFGDTYTPKADGSPDLREQRQFAKLDRNAETDNRIYVRLPKPWMVGEEINPDRLKEFTRKLCREVKKAVDEGRIADGKDKFRLEQLFEELTKRRKAGREKEEGPAPDPIQPRP